MQLTKKEKRLQMLLILTTLVLLLAAILTTGSTFAAYLTSARSADSARVAGWNVTMTGGSDVAIDGSVENPNLSGVYSLTVSNNSEVAAKYEIAVSTTTALPKGITLTMNGTARPTDGTTTAFTFPGGSLAPQTSSGAIDLTITADLDVLNVDVTNVPVTVSVHAEQID